VCGPEEWADGLELARVPEAEARQERDARQHKRDDAGSQGRGGKQDARL
jgi:hypothetical protein